MLGFSISFSMSPLPSVFILFLSSVSIFGVVVVVGSFAVIIARFLLSGMVMVSPMLGAPGFILTSRYPPCSIAITSPSPVRHSTSALWAVFPASVML